MPPTAGSYRCKSANAVDPGGPVGRQESVADVLEHHFAWSFARVAVTATGAGPDPDHVPLVHLERRDDSVPLDRPVPSDHLRVVGGAVESPGQSPRGVPVPRVRACEEAAVGANPVVEEDAPAAAVAAFAAGFLVPR